MNDIRTLLTQFLDIARAMAELIILFVPAPWNMSIVFLIGSLIALLGWYLILQVARLLSYIILSIVEFIVGLLVWPEYLATQQMRRCGLDPIQEIYLYGAIVSSPARLLSFAADGLSAWIQNRRWFSWFSWFWLMLIAALPTVLWYARPILEGTTMISYIDSGFQWWWNVETWIQTGEWRT